jgi:putative spermidine/putrescine transport system substrate-binding protein
MAGYRLDRRHLLGGTAATLLARPALAQQRTPLTVAAYGGVFEKALREHVIPRFEAENPYDVTLVVTDDSNIIPRLLTARGRAPWDVITVNDDAATLLKARGLLAPDQSAELPELDQAYPSMRPPRTVIYGTTIYEYDLVYRTAAFPTPPTSWQDLWRPGLTVGVPYVGQSYGMTFLYIAALLNGGDGSNLDPGFAAIKRLGNAKIYNNVGQGLTLFQQGEIDAALYYAHRGQQLIGLGFPVARVKPKEGVYAQRTGTQIPKGAGNPAGALAWVRASLSAPYQAAFVPEFYSPANQTVLIPPAQAASFISGAAEVAQLRDPPWDVLLPQRDAVLDRWRREMG